MVNKAWKITGESGSSALDSKQVLPDLASMSVQTLSKLQQSRPYGVSEIGNIDAVSSQQMYKKTCFRIDVDNLYGTNFKQLSCLNTLLRLRK